MITQEVTTEMPQHWIARLRAHPHAKPVESGWRMIDDRNVVGNRVLLISEHNAMMVEFKHGEPYADHLRAYVLAREYANDHPEVAPKRELVTQPLFRPLGEVRRASDIMQAPGF